MVEGDGMSAPWMLGSVIIPAHNEAAVIRRCLDSLLSGFRPGELDVVVSCNACTDGTADIVRASGYQVRVVEIDVASKNAALRAAEQVLSVLPRLYLDADVILTSSAARCVLESLRIGEMLAARPPIQYNTNGSPLVVRRYYRARSEVPEVMGSLWGAGVFGLSAAGRVRFGDFPEVTADDLFVDQHFQRSEITIVDAPPVVVNVPRRTSDLVRILRRVYQGNAENRAMFTELHEDGITAPSTGRALVRLGLSRPTRLVDVAIYLSIAVLARISLKIASPPVWERDNSSRRTGLATDSVTAAQKMGT